MKRAAKIVLLTTLILLILMLCAITTFYIVTADAKLDKSKLIDYDRTIEIYDDEGNLIENATVDGNKSSVNVGDLPDHVKNAFIASEDRVFYRHNGLNYKRMAMALFKNIASFSFKEGASTISQQLIKNTHLSNSKTLTRKLKEIKLTRQLEKKYSKNEILEMYLNTIYFGHSCYGLQSAARFYFGCDAPDLTLEQGAQLAGLLVSPNNYSPFKDEQKSIKRRNIVLNSMLECGFITRKQFEEACKKPSGHVKGDPPCSYGSFTNAVFNELDGLNLNAYSDLSGCKIYTSLNSEIQSAVENIPSECDISILITDENNMVCAYRSTVGDVKRQPASTIKPLLVYAPAIEEKLIHSFTKIDDSPVTFGSYSPENYDKKYHGEVTVAESIAKSYNIPAVKTLNALGCKKSAEYAEKLSIALDEGDETLALALGGMKHGVTLKNLCDGYTVFRRGGCYSPSKFISKITDRNGNVIYSANFQQHNVFSPGTASVINEMLEETAKTGTAKKLKNITFDIAAKTGTAGDDKGNTDAYAIAYTSENTFAVWMGDRENKKFEITGGGACCDILKQIIENYYNSPPAPLETNKGTATVEIDRAEYNRGKIVLAEKICPALNKLKVKCIDGNTPKQISTRFSNPSIAKPHINVDKDSISIVLCMEEYYSILVKCDNEIIYDGPICTNVTDRPKSGRHVYSVTPYYSSGNNKYFGECITLPEIFISEEDNIAPLPPPITQKDWFYN